ncbi:MAG: mechanosensitive ion channel family protein [candidate division SR1 bacterium]|nr:mechanosensitive ion channel family protein [candidate division SR1 bacterium]
MINKITPEIIKNLTQNRGSILGKAALAIGVFLVIYFISNYIVQRVRKRIIDNSLQTEGYTEKIAKLSGNIVRVFFLVFNILAVFQIIGFDTALIMGGISLSIGFAMQTTIENMVAGVMFITNKKIKLGDFVEFLGSINTKGTIEEINIKYTIIRSFDKRRLIIPNSIMASTPIKTFKTEPLMRGEFTIKVPRHVDIEQVKQLLNDAINANKYVVQKEYTNTIITGFDSFGIGLKSFFYSSPAKKSPAIIARDIKPIVLEAFKKYGISIPFNHMTITT